MDTPTLRILDASLNRAAEGLRVVEDYARFALDDAHLTGLAKSLRHDLALAGDAVPTGDQNATRNTQGDVGATITTASEAIRDDAWDVCLASLKRTEQSLRSLEEYGKLLSAEFAAAIEAIRYCVYTLEKALDTTQGSAERLAETRLCVLLDGQRDAASFGELVRSLVKAGVGMIQLREKSLEGRDLVARARTLVSTTRDTPTLAIINDRADIAAVSGADGVHLGQTDLSVHDARSIVGPRTLVGVSTHSLEQARQAVLDGASYLGAGPIFPSQTKTFEEFPGLDYLRELAAEISLPTFAIGGIDVGNVALVREAGMNRVAVSRAVAKAESPAEAATRLLAALNDPSASAGG